MTPRILPIDRPKSKYLASPWCRVRIAWRRLQLAYEASPLLQVLGAAVPIGVAAYVLLWVFLASF